MNRYDQGWYRGSEYDFNARRRTPGYGADYVSWGNPRGRAWGGAPSAGFQGRGVGLYRGWGTAGQAGPRGGYDRGVYGDRYPEFGGYPGGRERGTYYGGRGGYETRSDVGYDRDFGRGRSYGRGGMGYDAGYAQEPFIPEAAYQRHPEYNRPQMQPVDRWPARGHDLDAGPMELDDKEIRQAVRENLHQDRWLNPDRLQVEVSDGVVTLTGEVDDYLEARYAWDDAWETAGVRGVLNNLTIRTDQPQEKHGDTVPQTAGGKKGTASKK
jgi:hypothetical protein